MGEDEFDLAGFCVGTVEHGRVLDGTTARAGDAIVGLAASGLHANGYSLVRTIVRDRGLDLAAPYAPLLEATLGGAPADVSGSARRRLATGGGPVPATLGEALLEPTRIYAGAILALRDALDAGGHRLGGVAHVTGGGLPGNVPRALPDHLGARLDPERWEMPGIMRLMGALGGMGDVELRATFNGGLGMVVVVDPAGVADAVASLAASGIAAARVGEVAPVDELDGRRYAEGPLGS